MSTNKELEEYRELIGKCVRCGACQAHCPVYLQKLDEGAVARGKLALAGAILDDEVTISRRLEEDIGLCLMCGSCTAKCPNKVPTDHIVGAIRRRIAAKKGVSLTGKTISTLTGSQPLLKTVLQSARALSPLVFKKLPQNSGLRLRFPFPPFQERTVPAIAEKNLFQLYGETIPGKPDKPVVGVFAGCSLTYLYPHIGAAMIELLKFMGCTIHLPSTQGCCGIPARSSGDGPTIEKLAQTNQAAFAGLDLDYIVTACATCASGIGELSETMSTDFADLSARVMDIHVFLHQQGLGELLSQYNQSVEKKRVSYHDPCHLRTKGIVAQPRALLQSLPNIDYIEMEDAAACCGLGGTFSIYHYHCSQAIGEKKLAGIRGADVDVVTTACPGCMMQLQDIVNHAGLTVKVRHSLELIFQEVQEHMIKEHST